MGLALGLVLGPLGFDGMAHICVQCHLVSVYMTQISPSLWSTLTQCDRRPKTVQMLQIAIFLFTGSATETLIVLIGGRYLATIACSRSRHFHHCV